MELVGTHPLEYALVARMSGYVYVDESGEWTDDLLRQFARDVSRDHISPKARVRRYRWCPTCDKPSPCERRQLAAR